MASSVPRWRARADVAWTGDETRVIAARTSPPDAEGPRILAGAAAWAWIRLVNVDDSADLVPEGPGHDVIIAAALEALAEADLLERA